MSNKISNAFKSVWESVYGAISVHPAAFTILCYTSLIMILDVKIGDVGMWAYPIATTPVFVVLALASDYIFGTRFKWLSWIMPVLMGLTVLIPGIEDWVDGTGFIVTTFVIVPIIVLLYRKSTSDDRFVKNGVWTGFSLVLSLILASLLASVISGILISAEALFGIDIGNSLEITVILSYVLTAPMIFIGFSEHENIPSISRILEISINWILSPAIVIYTVILFLYIGKILITWSLPCGGVAVMCLSWGIVMITIEGVQPLLSKHPYAWFARNCGYIAIPILAMLWVAIIKRTSQYGITPDRYFLIICGISMTTAFTVRMLKVSSGFFKIAAITASLFTMGLIAPAVNYRSVTACSQKVRTQWDDGDTRNGDTSENIELFAVKTIDRISVEEFTGIALNITLPIHEVDGRRYFDIDGIHIYVDDLIEQQLTKIGATETSPADYVRDKEEEFLIYEHPNFTIFFCNMNLIRNAQDGYSMSDSQTYLDTKAILYR